MKSKLTMQIESEFMDYIYNEKYELAVPECKMGFGGKKGIVDVLSYSGKSIANGRGNPRTREVTWRCYEIKISKGDFYSKSKWTFEGHYNYFVLPADLYEIVKADIPSHVGVYSAKARRDGSLSFSLVKRPKKMKLKMSESQLMHDFVVSTARDTRKWAHYNNLKQQMRSK